MSWNNSVDFSILVGKTLISVTSSLDEILFKTVDGDTYRMYHEQDCCESVTLDDICGDLEDLVGSPILVAEEVTSYEKQKGLVAPGYQDSFTWTFYKIDTLKGGVTIRWYGESNGYYSEAVDFEKVI